MPPTDPYRTLGLAPDATLDEIKRAYRRLAKVHHPDAAGDAATRRFLEIQGAYEQLLAARGGLRGRAGRVPGSRPTWPADPARTRATWEQARRRRASTPPDAEAGGAPPRPPGAAPEGEKTRRRGTGTGSGERPHRRKATPGSTTYDEAHEPIDPTWHGASWYGVTSGEYWTINPREYADPRKHGPEYQARAARKLPSASGDAPAPPAAAGPSRAVPPPDPTPAPPPVEPVEPAEAVAAAPEGVPAAGPVGRFLAWLARMLRA